MASLFDTLEIQAFRSGIPARTKQSRLWFQRKIKALGAVNRAALMTDDALKDVSKPRIGDMIMYFYDPKTKETLPFYDRFPLTIMVQPAPGGFHGLNLHYLSPSIRAVFLDRLMQLAPAQVKETTRITRLRYNLLKGTESLKEFKPCFKHYLMSHVVSNMARVSMPEWEIAVFLPTQQFAKKSSSYVWKDSRNQYKVT